MALSGISFSARRRQRRVKGTGTLDAYAARFIITPSSIFRKKKNAGHLNTLSARCAGEMKRQNTELTGGRKRADSASDLPAARRMNPK